MQRSYFGLVVIGFAILLGLTSALYAAGPSRVPKVTPPAERNEGDSQVPQKLSRSVVLVGSLTVFALAVFVGFEVIAKVPPTLHTPLMSGSNAISGITVVGAMITAGNGLGGLAALMGFLAVILAMVNVVGGFVVTQRMLKMFKKR